MLRKIAIIVNILRTKNFVVLTDHVHAAVVDPSNTPYFIDGMEIIIDNMYDFVKAIEKEEQQWQEIKKAALKHRKQRGANTAKTSTKKSAKSEEWQKFPKGSPSTEHSQEKPDVKEG
jgi:DNA polymerase sigma